MKKIINLIIVLILLTGCGQSTPGGERSDILYLGDSITYLCGIEYPEGMNGDNFAVPGDGINEVLDIVRGIQTHYTHVEVLIGTNNSDWMDTVEFGSKIKSLIYMLGDNTDIKIYSLLPSVIRYQPNALAYNMELEYIAGGYPNVEYIDVYDRFLTAEGTMNALLYSDDIHLNRAGCKVWRPE